jgi:predicted nucleotidyltransferase
LCYRSKAVNAPDISLAIADTALRHGFPQLKLLVLHGSRARGQAHERSDWDFAYLAEDGLDLPGLILELGRLTDSDHVDVADLSRSSGLLRHRVASDGKLLFERSPREFERFVIESTRFWLDVAPVVRESQEAVLRGLG